MRRLSIIAVIALTLIAIYTLQKNDPVVADSPLAPQPVATDHTESAAAAARKLEPRGMAPVPAEAPVDASAKNRMDLGEFRELTSKTQGLLPKVSDLRKLGADEVHRTPELIREAGTALGNIAQALHDNPALASEAKAFYQECFQRTELPAQIRGLCLANHRNLRVQNGDRPEWTADEAKSDKSIKNLADKIPLPSK